MTEPRNPGFPDSSSSDPYDSERKVLRAEVDLSYILKDNTIYRGYANGTGPLTQAHVDHVVLNSWNFASARDQFGWPDAGESTPGFYDIPDYVDDEFRNNFTKNIGDEKALGNFRKLLEAFPLDDIAQLDPNDLTSVYGLSPALHRGYAIAPDLFLNLRTILKQLNDRQEVIEYIELPGNESFIEAAEMAYRILIRLVMAQDYSDRVHSAHDALTR